MCFLRDDSPHTPLPRLTPVFCCWFQRYPKCSLRWKKNFLGLNGKLRVAGCLVARTHLTLFICRAYSWNATSRSNQGGGTALNCGTYESLMVLKYFQAFETHPPPSVYFSLHGTKIFSTMLHPPPLGGYFSLHGTKMKFDQRDPTHPLCWY